MRTSRLRILILALLTGFVAGPAFAQRDAPVHTVLPAPTLPPDDSVDADTSPLVCRAPQKQTESRLLPSKVCKTQRQWDDLHARGLDMSPDGRNVVATEKYRSLHPNACGSTAGCF